MKLIEIVKQEKIWAIILFLSLISMFRSFVIPLGGDEITYLKISDNILQGKFYLDQYPSTFNPIIPFILTFFRTDFLPELGFILNKSFNILLFGVGIRFLYLFLNKQHIDKKVSLAIVALTVATPICVSTASSLYPDAILFFAFWGFVYYCSQEVNSNNFGKILFFFTLLFLVRYLYAVLGIFVLYRFYLLIKLNPKNLTKACFYGMLALVPVVIWLKYVYNVESNQLTQLTYFNRFKEENALWYNIKAGLGIIQHHEVKRINGIPAFINLWIPITGFRNFTGSILLLMAFIAGYIFRKKSYGINLLLYTTLLIMLGLIVAGTGFTRYWMPLIPAYYLGFYFLLEKFKIKNKYPVYGMYILSFIYLLNEMRLNFTILSTHL